MIILPNLLVTGSFGKEAVAFLSVGSIWFISMFYLLIQLARGPRLTQGITDANRSKLNGKVISLGLFSSSGNGKNIFGVHLNCQIFTDFCSEFFTKIIGRGVRSAYPEIDTMTSPSNTSGIKQLSRVG